MHSSAKYVIPLPGSEQSGDREVQRTMLELLNQLDGFEVKDDIKVHQYRHKTVQY